MSIIDRAMRAAAIARVSGGRFFLLRHVKPPIPLKTHSGWIELHGPATEGTRNSYAEIFAQDAYRFLQQQDGDLKVIVDIGANIGLFACWAAARCPSAQVFAFEPNPQAFQYLAVNAARVPNITPYPCAVSHVLTSAEMEETNDSIVGTIRQPSGLTRTVACIHPRDICQEQTIDFLKIDCEGSEFDLLQDPGLLQRTRVCALEYHVSEEYPLGNLLELIRQGHHTLTGSLPQDPRTASVGYLYTKRTE